MKHEPSNDIRVAVVTTHPPGKGTLNEYAYHFVRFLRQKPEVSEVILLVDDLPPGGQYPSDDNDAEAVAPLRFVPCWRFGAWNNALRILAAVRQAKPDVALFNLQFATFGDGKVPATLGLLTPALIKALGIPTIVLLHNIMETVDLQSAGFAGNRLMEAIIRFFGAIVTRLILAADMVGVTIPQYAEILERKYGTDNVFLALHGHGVFDEDALPTYEIDPPPGPLQIMTFGKFGTYKKVEPLIEAFKRLQDGSRPPLELVIAGSDSPNTPGYLESVRQQYADVENIRFTGYVPEADVPRIFQEAAVVVFPYTSTTGSSGVLHQAGSYGKAVVLPNLGDFAELIAEEGYVGEFFEPGDPQSLADALARVLDDPVHRTAMGIENRIAGAARPISQVVDAYLMHFQALLEKRQGGRA